MAEEAEAFASQEPQIDHHSATSGDNINDTKSSSSNKTVPLYKLFGFSDGWDKLLMFLGSVGAIGNGLNPSLMAFLFGQLADAFGSNQSGPVLPIVSRVALKLVYVAVGCGVGAMLRKYIHYIISKFYL